MIEEQDGDQGVSVDGVSGIERIDKPGGMFHPDAELQKAGRLRVIVGLFRKILAAKGMDESAGEVKDNPPGESREKTI